jgi:hypothetical protein
MKPIAEVELAAISEIVSIDAGSSGTALVRVLPETTQLQLEKMFRDPRLLSKEERSELIENLQFCVKAAPGIAELRVLLGMAECVDFQVHSAMENLREAVRIDENNFLAHFKLGELLMRLRICDQAVIHTECAARLAANTVQSELTRRQAAALRTMLREGIERDSSTHPIRMVLGWIRKLGARPVPGIAIVGPE